MKNTILFDFFGVISGEIAPVWLAKHFPEDEAASLKSKIAGKADSGDVTIEEMFAEVSAVSNIPVDIVRKEWFELAIINQELVEFIKTLKGKYNLYLLSNAISDFIRPILKENNLEELFDKIYISSEIRLVKPSKEFFDYCLKDSNINPKDAIFIDDNISNVNSAIAAGIDSMLYKNNQEFFEDFAKYLK